MAQVVKKKVGRPRKSPNDTETAPYVKHRYETEGKRGRPKNNPYEGSGWGGAREGGGRPESVPDSEKLSYVIAFSCCAATKERYRLLKENGFNIAEAMREYVNRMAKMRLGAKDIPDDWVKK